MGTKATRFKLTRLEVVGRFVLADDGTWVDTGSGLFCSWKGHAHRPDPQSDPEYVVSAVWTATALNKEQRIRIFARYDDLASAEAECRELVEALAEA